MNPISHNTYLKFYRSFLKTEKEARAAAKKSMAQQHLFIRGEKK